MDIICCPMCKTDLELKIDEEKNDDVITGKLTCTKCKTIYPIKDSIPNLLPQTK